MGAFPGTHWYYMGHGGGYAYTVSVNGYALPRDGSVNIGPASNATLIVTLQSGSEPITVTDFNASGSITIDSTDATPKVLTNPGDTFNAALTLDASGAGGVTITTGEDGDFGGLIEWALPGAGPDYLWRRKGWNRQERRRPL